MLSRSSTTDTRSRSPPCANTRTSLRSHVSSTMSSQLPQGDTSSSSIGGAAEASSELVVSRDQRFWPDGFARRLCTISQPHIFHHIRHIIITSDFTGSGAGAHSIRDMVRALAVTSQLSTYIPISIVSVCDRSPSIQRHHAARIAGGPQHVFQRLEDRVSPAALDRMHKALQKSVADLQFAIDTVSDDTATAADHTKSYEFYGKQLLCELMRILSAKESFLDTAFCVVHKQHCPLPHTAQQIVMDDGQLINVANSSPHILRIHVAKSTCKMWHSVYSSISVSLCSNLFFFEICN
jgi:hypothetical protein